MTNNDDMIIRSLKKNKHNSALLPCILPEAFAVESITPEGLGVGGLTNELGTVVGLKDGGAMFGL